MDTIAGATISSRAMLSAVSDCVTQAGGDLQKLQTVPQKTGGTEKEMSADVVIVVVAD